MFFLQLPYKYIFWSLLRKGESGPIMRDMNFRLKKKNWNKATSKKLTTFFLPTCSHAMFFIKELQAIVLKHRKKNLLELWIYQAPENTRNIMIICNISHLKSEDLHVRGSVSERQSYGTQYSATCYAYQSIKPPLKLQTCSEDKNVASIYIVQWCNFLKK